jgi:hypothetical protein
VLENKWRYARVKLNIAAAGDSGAIENITPTTVFSLLKSQQGVDVQTGLASCRVMSIFSYAVPGVADSGGQTYPSTKLRIYTPMEDSTQGVLLEQREDQGTLDEPARIGYHYPIHLKQRVLNEASTSYFCQLEQYHCARGYIYIDLYWTTSPN